jgi:hypothetical protein
MIARDSQITCGGTARAHEARAASGGATARPMDRS